MANEEHVAILKQGVEVWNEWREEKSHIRPDFSMVDLSWLDLSQVNLADADLTNAFLRGANLARASLINADLSNYVRLNSQAPRTVVGILGANLSKANLVGADLSMADLSDARLEEANLSHTRLTQTDFTQSSLHHAYFSGAVAGGSRFGNVDLRTVRGLQTIVHKGPSTIGIDTIYRSKGQIPEVFLRGCGVPDTFIEFARSLALSERPIDYYSCFISYSSDDEAFAQRLHADLQDNGVRCWFAPEDMKIGDKIRQRIDESIRIHDKLLLVLSDNSIDSQWVEKEVETAWEEERQRGETVLFPVRLDDSVMETDQAWAADIRCQRHIEDFREWKEHDSYQDTFERLLRDLKAEE